MTGTERRQKLIEELQASGRPVSGDALGKKFGVSRQVIVQDVALLRTAGHGIESTNRGYIIIATNPCTRLVKVQHSNEQIEQELNTLVDLGVTVVDVMVNHRTYGQMRAELNLSSRRDVRRFVDDLKSGVSSPLMNVTSGYHFHRISACSEDLLDEAVEALRELGFLAPLTPFEEESLA